MIPETLFQYFPNLSGTQKEQFKTLESLYQDWNTKINVVSRKDIDELYLRHVLHSLGIAKVYTFQPDQKVLDVGTGGGFPGIPLAILFPDTQFTLVDAIGKKIRVVEEVVSGLGLSNVSAVQTRVEDVKGSFDFIVSRAVAAMPTFVHWTRGKLKKTTVGDTPPGILYLKGGDLTDELKPYPGARIYALSEYFKEPFFETKKVVYLSRADIGKP
ncbi:16S rRNA (guanine(527)-N(7))-methyltransferase RsmG [Robiginitalea aurantiaca]|uniref:Ribosomal RNA small subunit methyltransferase G n=1 Tax=Robiginitalea aurantiaca TaxID=3056915 RepID=A0ABT7WIL4_9FLAO|nr:16S rRNA (guanine(527)-N(7))-methyltransferase RsmG [Robiginitalea aurantiaca]MDM9632757.1 16S rRNA (guanine(527)-N(7))-methyltransferase RsmG [Robiginitalea aurantiaca]